MHIYLYILRYNKEGSTAHYFCFHRAEYILKYEWVTKHELVIHHCRAVVIVLLRGASSSNEKQYGILLDYVYLYEGLMLNDQVLSNVYFFQIS